MAIAKQGGTISVVPGILVVILAISLFSSCQDNNRAFIDKLIELSPARYRDEMPSEEKIAEWEQEIRRYKSVLEQQLEAAGKVASFYKLIAEEYSTMGMFSLALENYRQAIDVEPANQVLLYSAGVAAAQVGLAKETRAEELEYLNIARRYYERAMEIAPGYQEPYLGLTVLLLFEFEDIDAAKELADRALQIFPNYTRMMFIQARIAVEEDRTDEAAAIYDRISRVARNPGEINSAISNREALIGGE